MNCRSSARVPGGLAPGPNSLHEVPRIARAACCCLLLLALLTDSPALLYAQDASAVETWAGEAPAPIPAPRAAEETRRDINFLSLLIQGGIFMIPILVMSLIAVTCAIERAFGLRRARVLPDGLVRALGQLGAMPGGFDPKMAYRACQQYPSAAANVIRSLLLKVGRPHGEIEHAVQDTSQREAERLFSNVRWLNLAAAVTPLLGLLGTVWGMIVAFHDTTMLAPGQNKAEFLAEGIYIALVTTLGGLIVAIPSAVASHLFEGRIQTLFHQIDEMVFSLLPQVERFEGRVRFGRHVESPERTHLGERDVEPPPVVPDRSAAAT
jgi:biopolymer transport protein ExbB